MEDYNKIVEVTYKWLIGQSEIISRREEIKYDAKFIYYDETRCYGGTNNP